MVYFLLHELQRWPPSLTPTAVALRQLGGGVGDGVGDTWWSGVDGPCESGGEGEGEMKLEVFLG